VSLRPPPEQLSPCSWCAGTGKVRTYVEWWIVTTSGFGVNRGLDYWGPYTSEQEARRDKLFREGCVVVEVAT